MYPRLNAVDDMFPPKWSVRLGLRFSGSVMSKRRVESSNSILGNLPVSDVLASNNI